MLQSSAEKLQRKASQDKYHFQVLQSSLENRSARDPELLWQTFHFHFFFTRTCLQCNKVHYAQLSHFLFQMDLLAVSLASLTQKRLHKILQRQPTFTLLPLYSDKENELENNFTKNTVGVLLQSH